MDTNARKNMKKLLLTGIVMIAGFCGSAQTTAVEMNDKMVDITDKVFEYGDNWGRAFQVGMDKLDWSNLKPIRVKMQQYVNSAIQEVEALPEVKGSKALQDIVVEFLNYENKVINEGFKPFENFDGNEDEESLKKAIDRMVALGNGETDLLEKVMEVQEAYAKANGFKVGTEEEAAKTSKSQK
jgi:hypothetical protein